MTQWDSGVISQHKTRLPMYFAENTCYLMGILGNKLYQDQKLRKELITLTQPYYKESVNGLAENYSDKLDSHLARFGEVVAPYVETICTVEDAPAVVGRLQDTQITN